MSVTCNHDKCDVEEAVVLDYPSIGGQTCHYQALSNIFRYYGYELPEEFIFLLLRSFYDKETAVNIPYFCSQSFRKIGFLLNSHQLEVKNNFFVIKGLINAKIPVIMNVDGNKMPYFPKNTILEFPEHLIIVYGYKGNQLLVSDVYVPFYPPEVVTCWIDQEDILGAIPDENGVKYVYTVEPENPANFSPADIYRLGMKKMLEVLLAENKFRCRFIESADLANLKFHPDAISQLAKKTRGDLLSNGGPVETRKFLANIFTQIGQNTEKALEYGTYFANRSEDWKGIANACIKFAVLGDSEYFKKQILFSYELAQGEIKYMEQIKDFI